jgi:hypothetical protein
MDQTMKKIIVDSFEEFVKKFSNQDLDVVSELFSSVKIAIAKNRKKANIFSVYCRETEETYKLSIDKEEYPTVLNGCMNVFVKNEMYEECSQIKSILEILNKK